MTKKIINLVLDASNIAGKISTDFYEIQELLKNEDKKYIINIYYGGKKYLDELFGNGKDKCGVLVFYKFLQNLKDARLIVIHILDCEQVNNYQNYVQDLFTSIGQDDPHLVSIIEITHQVYLRGSRKILFVSGDKRCFSVIKNKKFYTSAKHIPKIYNSKKSSGAIKACIY